MNDVLVMHEMKEIKAAIEIEKVSNSASWGSFFGSVANRRRIGAIVLVGAATQLAGNGESTSTTSLTARCRPILSRPGSQDRRYQPTRADSRYQRR